MIDPDAQNRAPDRPIHPQKRWFVAAGFGFAIMLALTVFAEAMASGSPEDELVFRAISVVCGGPIAVVVVVGVWSRVRMSPVAAARAQLATAPRDPRGNRGAPPLVRDTNLARGPGGEIELDGVAAALPSDVAVARDSVGQERLP